MSAVKKYFKEQWQPHMCGLDNVDPAQFYLSVWQTNRSATPLFALRLFLFLSSFAIVLASTILYIQDGIYQFWFIYLTHWGLTVNLLTTLFATVVSGRYFCYGPSRTNHQLPCYVKIYWVLYNIAAPLAFLITLFYWTVLFEAGKEEEPDYGLDIAVHGLNSLVMLTLVGTSAQPNRLLHVYQPIVFATVYFFFTLIYYLAGGVDDAQNPYVYYVLDWRNPGATVGVAILTGVLLLLLYLCTIGIVTARNTLAIKHVKPAVFAKEELPLNQPSEGAQTTV